MPNYPCVQIFIILLGLEPKKHIFLHHIHEKYAQKGEDEKEKKILKKKKE